MLVGQRISQIPPYGLQNYIAGILAALERICHCDRHGLFTLSVLILNFAMKPIAECAELGATKLIPESPLEPGDIFSVGYEASAGRVALFRVQAAVMPGGGKLQVVGITSKAIKEAARMAFDYLRINGKKFGLDRDLSSYDFNIQVMSPMSGKDTEDLGVA